MGYLLKLTFVEEQAFLPCYDLAPIPPPTPSPFLQQVVSLSQSVFRRSSLRTEEVRVGYGMGPNDGEKAWSSVNHSILYGNIVPVADLDGHITVSETLLGQTFVPLRAQCANCRGCLIVHHS
jgi:hypothetical protein